MKASHKACVVGAAAASPFRTSPTSSGIGGGGGSGNGGATVLAVCPIVDVLQDGVFTIRAEPTAPLNSFLSTDRRPSSAAPQLPKGVQRSGSITSPLEVMGSPTASGGGGGWRLVASLDQHLAPQYPSASPSFSSSASASASMPAIRHHCRVLFETPLRCPTVDYIGLSRNGEGTFVVAVLRSGSSSNAPAPLPADVGTTNGVATNFLPPSSGLCMPRHAGCHVLAFRLHLPEPPAQPRELTASAVGGEKGSKTLRRRNGSAVRDVSGAPLPQQSSFSQPMGSEDTESGGGGGGSLLNFSLCASDGVFFWPERLIGGPKPRGSAETTTACTTNTIGSTAYGLTSTVHGDTTTTTLTSVSSSVADGGGGAYAAFLASLPFPEARLGANLSYHLSSGCEAVLTICLAAAGTAVEGLRLAASGKGAMHHTAALRRGVGLYPNVIVSVGVQYAGAGLGATLRLATAATATPTSTPMTTALMGSVGGGGPASPTFTVLSATVMAPDLGLGGSFAARLSGAAPSPPSAYEGWLQQQQHASPSPIRFPASPLVVGATGIGGGLQGMPTAFGSCLPVRVRSTLRLLATPLSCAPAAAMLPKALGHCHVVLAAARGGGGDGSTFGGAEANGNGNAASSFGFVCAETGTRGGSTFGPDDSLRAEEDIVMRGLTPADRKFKLKVAELSSVASIGRSEAITACALSTDAGASSYHLHLQHHSYGVLGTELGRVLVIQFSVAAPAAAGSSRADGKRRKVPNPTADDAAEGYTQPAPLPQVTLLFVSKQPLPTHVCGTVSAVGFLHVASSSSSTSAVDAVVAAVTARGAVVVMRVAPKRRAGTSLATAGSNPTNGAASAAVPVATSLMGVVAAKARGAVAVCPQHSMLVLIASSTDDGEEDASVSMGGRRGSNARGALPTSTSSTPLLAVENCTASLVLAPMFICGAAHSTAGLAPSGAPIAPLHRSRHVYQQQQHCRVDIGLLDPSAAADLLTTIDGSHYGDTTTLLSGTAAASILNNGTFATILGATSSSSAADPYARLRFQPARAVGRPLLPTSALLRDLCEDEASDRTSATSLISRCLAPPAALAASAAAEAATISSCMQSFGGTFSGSKFDGTGGVGGKQWGGGSLLGRSNGGGLWPTPRGAVRFVDPSDPQQQPLPSNRRLQFTTTTTEASSGRSILHPHHQQQHLPHQDETTSLTMLMEGTEGGGGGGGGGNSPSGGGRFSIPEPIDALFAHVRSLGSGAFGAVTLAQSRARPSDFFAVKRVPRGRDGDAHATMTLATVVTDYAGGAMGGGGVVPHHHGAEMGAEGGAGDADAVRTFFQEAVTAMAAIPPHPNVVRYHGIYASRAFHCIVMDVADGGTLDSVLFPPYAEREGQGREGAEEEDGKGSQGGEALEEDAACDNDQSDCEEDDSGSDAGDDDGSFEENDTAAEGRNSSISAARRRRSSALPAAERRRSSAKDKDKKAGAAADARNPYQPNSDDDFEWVTDEEDSDNDDVSSTDDDEEGADVENNKKKCRKNKNGAKGGLPNGPAARDGYGTDFSRAVRRCDEALAAATVHSSAMKRRRSKAGGGSAAASRANDEDPLTSVLAESSDAKGPSTPNDTSPLEKALNKHEQRRRNRAAHMHSEAELRNGAFASREAVAAVSSSSLAPTAAASSAPPHVPEHRLVCWLHQSLVGLRHLHRSGVVHRDVKPANMLLSEEGTFAQRLQWTDFGVSTVEAVGSGGGANHQQHAQTANTAVAASAAAAAARRTAYAPPPPPSATVSGPRTAHRTVIGTMGFTAPELLERWGAGGTARYSSACDLWGLGVVFYCYLTGRGWLPSGGCVGVACSPSETIDVCCGRLPSLCALKAAGVAEGVGSSDDDDEEENEEEIGGEKDEGVSEGKKRSRGEQRNGRSSYHVSALQLCREAPPLGRFSHAQQAQRAAAFSSHFLALVDSLMAVDHRRRPTAEAALRSPLFSARLERPIAVASLIRRHIAALRRQNAIAGTNSFGKMGEGAFLQQPADPSPVPQLQRALADVYPFLFASVSPHTNGASSFEEYAHAAAEEGHGRLEHSTRQVRLFPSALRPIDGIYEALRSCRSAAADWALQQQQQQSTTACGSPLCAADGIIIDEDEDSSCSWAGPVMPPVVAATTERSDNGKKGSVEEKPSLPPLAKGKTAPSPAKKQRQNATHHSDDASSKGSPPLLLASPSVLAPLRSLAASLDAHAAAAESDPRALFLASVARSRYRGRVIAASSSYAYMCPTTSSSSSLSPSCAKPLSQRNAEKPLPHMVLELCVGLSGCDFTAHAERLREAYVAEMESEAAAEAEAEAARLWEAQAAAFGGIDLRALPDSSTSTNGGSASASSGDGAAAVRTHHRHLFSGAASSSLSSSSLSSPLTPPPLRLIAVSDVRVEGQTLAELRPLMPPMIRRGWERFCAAHFWRDGPSEREGYISQRRRRTVPAGVATVILTYAMPMGPTGAAAVALRRLLAPPRALVGASGSTTATSSGSDEGSSANTSPAKPTTQRPAAHSSHCGNTSGGVTEGAKRQQPSSSSASSSIIGEYAPISTAFPLWVALLRGASTAGGAALAEAEAPTLASFQRSIIEAIAAALELHRRAHRRLVGPQPPPNVHVSSGGSPQPPPPPIPAPPPHGGVRPDNVFIPLPPSSYSLEAACHLPLRRLLAAVAGALVLGPRDPFAAHAAAVERYCEAVEVATAVGTQPPIAATAARTANSASARLKATRRGSSSDEGSSTTSLCCSLAQTAASAATFNVLVADCPRLSAGAALDAAHTAQLCYELGFSFENAASMAAVEDEVIKAMQRRCDGGGLPSRGTGATG